MKRILTMSAIALAVLVVDQAAKAWIVSNMVSHDTRILIAGFLRLRYTENTGAAFGLFQGWTGVLSIAAAAIIVTIVLSASRMGNGSRVITPALALVLGGALGNLLDRIRLGYVVDFIELYGPRIEWQGVTYTWPVFNVADSAITIGVLLIMATLLFDGKTKEQESHLGTGETEAARDEKQEPSPGFRRLPTED